METSPEIISSVKQNWRRCLSAASVSRSHDAGLQLVVGNLPVRAGLDQVQTPSRHLPPLQVLVKALHPCLHARHRLVSSLLCTTCKMTRSKLGEPTAIALTLRPRGSATRATLYWQQLRAEHGGDFGVTHYKAASRGHPGVCRGWLCSPCHLPACS